MQSESENLFTLSTLFLVLANLVPVAGAYYLGWDLSSVLLIYWVESAVIGIYNFCKILVIGGWAALFSGLFFTAHFGAFMAVHLMFLNHVFFSEMESTPFISIKALFEMIFPLWPAVAALFISHGISFLQNFIGQQEYRDKTVNKQMHEPYQRIVFMQLVIIIGAGLMTVIGNSNIVLMLVIAAKIVADVRAHIRERTSQEPTSGTNYPI